MPIDYSKYPKNWKTEIVPRILKRADNKCEFCFIENKSTVFSTKFYFSSKGKFCCRSIWFTNYNDALRLRSFFSEIKEIKPIKVVLTIAHLDHDELNHTVDDSRLKALCQYCHLNYDSKEKIKRILKKGNGKK